MRSPGEKFTEADQLYFNALKLTEQGELARAAGLLSQITTRFENYGRAWYELGNILFRYLDDFEEAGECYRKCIELLPVFSPAYLALADVLLVTGEYAEMNAILNQADALRGVRKDMVRYKIAILMESQGRYDEAGDMFKKSLLASFSNEDIRKCEEGISRCAIKKKYS